VTTPPYPLAQPAFDHPALAACAGDAALGGAREVALAAFMTARLATGAPPHGALPLPVRAKRAAAAKLWLAALALPAASRVPFARAADATAGDDACALAAALRAVLAAVEPRLDGAAAAELRALAAAADSPEADAAPRRAPAGAAPRAR
jgi:hypothetical protein